MCSTRILLALLIGCLGPAVVLLSPSSLDAAEPPALTIHVAPDGDDDAPGAEAAPLRTLAAAKQRVRDRLAEEPASDIEVILHHGVYRLEAPLRFTPADVSPDHTVTWRAADGAEPRISGGRPITGWQEHPDGSFTTTLDDVADNDWSFRELFVNGERRQRARHPDTGYIRIEESGEDRRTNFTFRPDDIPAPLAGELAETGLEIVYFHDWSTTRVRVASIDHEEHRLHVVHRIGHDAPHYRIAHFEPHPRYYLENHPALLSVPGEWYLDERTGELTYLPKEGESPESIEVIAPVARGLIDVRGEPGEPVRGLIFRGLHFEHAAWPLPNRGYAAGQSAVYELRGDDESGRTFVPAALSFEIAEGCAVENGSIRRVGRSAVWFGSRTRHNRVAGNLIDDVAANGVMIGEDRSRRVGGQPWWQTAPEQVALDNIIEDNLIQRCGNTFYEAVGIWVGLAADTRIRHNTVRHVPYTGISVGWMWNPTPTPNRGTRIEHNHIHHVMQVLSDGGGIYTLGRQPEAVFRDNIIHDVPLNVGRAESNGMFIDEGSTELVIERNVIYHTDRSPLRFHQAEQNLVRQNLLVLPDADTPVFRFNNTAAENIRSEENTVLQADEFAPASIADDLARVGPRVQLPEPPDPREQ